MDVHRRTTIPDGGGGVGYEFVLQHITAAVRDAVAAEREVCADHLSHCADVAEAQGVAITVSGLRHVAAAIRGRTT